MKNLYLLLLIVPVFAFGQEITKPQASSTFEVTGFKMYPNPAYGNEVYITTPFNATKSVQIFDVFGDVVLRDKISTNSLDISRLVAGVYVIQVTENERTTTRKLVVK